MQTVMVAYDKIITYIVRYESCFEFSKKIICHTSKSMINIKSMKSG